MNCRLILVMLLVSVLQLPEAAAPGFSFSQPDLPSLADINGRKFKTAVRESVYLLTNVDASCDKYNLLQDEARNVYQVQNKSGQTLFEGPLDGIPRYAACVDIDRDNDQDVIVQVSAYGNRGNGSERFVVLLSDKVRMTPLQNSIQYNYIGGQEDRAGVLNWYSDSNSCATFTGEIADVTGSGSTSDPIRVANIRRVKEVWGHKNGQMVLNSSSSDPIQRQDAKLLTFR